MYRVNKIVFIIMVCMELSSHAYSQDSPVLTPEPLAQVVESDLTIQKILEDLRRIWPNGKCADHYSGDKTYVLVSFACASDYTAENREKFLDAMVARGFKITRENYHIDRHSANYFYKFQVDIDHDIYFKLFFRNPEIVWPLHEDARPRIMILLNDVRTLDELKPWDRINLPLTVSVSLLTSERDKIIEAAKKTNFDIWLFLPDFIYDWGLAPKPAADQTKKPENIENKDTSETKGTKDTSVQAMISEVAGKSPEYDFPYSGVSITHTNETAKNIEQLRLLFKTMRKEGLKQFAGPRTIEIRDTARVMQVSFANQTYYMNSSDSQFEAVWKTAYENSRVNKYSIIVLDVRDVVARNYLLKMIAETDSYVDYTTIKNLPPRDGLSGGQ